MFQQRPMMRAISGHIFVKFRDFQVLPQGRLSALPRTLQTQREAAPIVEILLGIPWQVLLNFRWIAGMKGADLDPALGAQRASFDEKKKTMFRDFFFF